MKAPRFSKASARARAHFTLLRGRGVSYEQARKRARLRETTAKKLEAWNGQREGVRARGVLMGVNTHVDPALRAKAQDAFVVEDREVSYQGNSGLGPRVADESERAVVELRAVRAALKCPEGMSVVDWAQGVIASRDYYRDLEAARGVPELDYVIEDAEPAPLSRVVIEITGRDFTMRAE